MKEEKTHEHSCDDRMELSLDVDLLNLGLWLRADNKFFTQEHYLRFTKWFLTIIGVNIF